MHLLWTVKNRQENMRYMVDDPLKKPERVSQNVPQYSGAYDPLKVKA